jgi:hypothetical protein
VGRGRGYFEKKVKDGIVTKLERKLQCAKEMVVFFGGSSYFFYLKETIHFEKHLAHLKLRPLIGRMACA